MTTSDIDRLARKYLSCPTSRRNIIKHVYNEERRIGLRVLARRITDIGSKKIKPRDLLRIAAINLGTKEEELNGKNNMVKAFRSDNSPNGRKGKMGGKQSLQTAQFYQSV